MKEIHTECIYPVMGHEVSNLLSNDSGKEIQNDRGGWEGARGRLRIIKQKTTVTKCQYLGIWGGVDGNFPLSLRVLQN